MFEEDKAALRAQLRSLRSAAGLTQIDMANRLELTQSYVSKLERGEFPLDVLLWRKWCYFCGVRPGEALDATFDTSPSN